MSETKTSYAGLRARAIESLLIEKGYLTEDAVDYVVSAYEQDIGPMRGARLVVREPRAVLRDFGLELPAGKEIRVWDSSSDMRYLVLPERPAGTEGLSEDELAALVTRDSMIGTGLPAAS